jgi:hypothetical protein
MGRGESFRRLWAFDHCFTSACPSTPLFYFFAIEPIVSAEPERRNLTGLRQSVYCSFVDLQISSELRRGHHGCGYLRPIFPHGVFGTFRSAGLHAGKFITAWRRRARILHFSRIEPHGIFESCQGPYRSARGRESVSAALIHCRPGITIRAALLFHSAGIIREISLRERGEAKIMYAVLTIAVIAAAAVTILALAVLISLAVRRPLKSQTFGPPEAPTRSHRGNLRGG